MTCRVRRSLYVSSDDVGAHYIADLVVEDSSSPTVDASFQQVTVSAETDIQWDGGLAKNTTPFSILFQWTVCKLAVRQILVVMASVKTLRRGSFDDRFSICGRCSH